MKNSFKKYNVLLFVQSECSFDGYTTKIKDFKIVSIFKKNDVAALNLKITFTVDQNAQNGSVFNK
jgi:hypothetical protein